MKENRLLNKVILLCVCLSFSFNAAAQVMIGSEDAPQRFSVLEIVSNANGLRLPQLNQEDREDNVALKGLTNLLEKNAAEGLVIFNMDTNVAEFWNGTEWIPFNTPTSAYDDIVVSPLFNTYASGDATVFTGAVLAAGTGDDLARGTGIEYSELSAGVFRYSGAEGQTVSTQEFTHESGLKVIIPGLTLANGSGTIGVKVAGTPSASYAGKAFDIPIRLMGKALKVRVNTGCGAYIGSKTTTNANNVATNWKQFQCFNLGADTNNSDPFNLSSSGTRDDVQGGMFQWGRKKDGHEVSSATPYNSGPLADGNLDGDGQPAAGYGQGQFVLSNIGNYDWRSTQSSTLWKDNEKTVNDPCPDGWRVPSQAQWEAIVNQNTQKWTSDSGEVAGRYMGDALFLPVTSSRASGTGNILPSPQSELGIYWSSTASGTYSSALQVSNSTAEMSTANGYRARGNGVRCIKID